MYPVILQNFHLLDKDVLAAYPYGSRVYQTAGVNSDHDFIIIADKVADDFALTSNDGKINVHLYSPDTFLDQVRQHKISALECIFLPKDIVLKDIIRWNFNLNKETLRSSISEKASHSWVKAKKKLEVEKDRDVYIAKKSLFHSLRIIEFGTQIAQHSKIVNYGAANHLWLEIRDNPANDWDTYKDKYQEYYNSKMTEFRKLAPKR